MLSYSYFDERVPGILGMIRLFYGNETKTEQDVMKLSAFLTEQHISLVCQVEFVRPKKKHPVAQKNSKDISKSTTAISRRLSRFLTTIGSA